MENCDLNIIVAADLKNIMMVEGEAKECSERDLIEAIKVAHEAIKVQCQAQLDLAQKVGGRALNKREVPVLPENDEINKKVEELGKEKLNTIQKTLLQQVCIIYWKQMT